jgi:putative PEP-CTERM system TPR-repeat lipoprotein
MRTHVHQPHTRKTKSLLRAILAPLLLLSLATSGITLAEGSTPILQQAKQALAKKDPRTAKIHLRNLLKKTPSNVAARTLLGSIYYAEKNYGGAAKELQIAIRLGAEDPNTLLLLAQSLLKQGNLEEVIDKIQVPDGASRPFAARVLAVRAQALVMSGKPEKAEAMFHEALELDPQAIDAITGLARFELTRKHLEPALKQAEQAIAIDPDDLQAWLIRAEAQQGLGRVAEARQAYERSLELAPDHPSALIGLATLDLQDGDVEAAKKRIDRTVEVAPHRIAGHYLQALMAYQEQDYDRAADILGNILMGTREHLPSQLLLGTIRYRQGQLEQARDRLSLFVTRVPGNPNARKLLAATLMKLRQADKAIEILTPIADASPDDPQILALLGSAHVQNGDTERGTELLSRAAELAPEAPAIRTQLALTQLASGNTEAAIIELQTAADLGMSQADFLLVITHIRQKEYDQAIATSKKLIEKMSDNPAPYNLLGAALAGKGDDEGARKAFAQALAMNPDATASRFNVARMDLRAGQREEAITNLDIILAKHPGHLGSATTRAGLAIQDGEQDQAQALLVAAYESHRDSVRAGLVLSRFYLQTKKPLDALRITREVSNKHGDNAAVQRVLGMALAATGDQQGARDAFRKVVAANPDSIADRQRLAITELGTGKLRSAEKNLRPVVAAKPDNLQLTATLAALHIQLKHYTDAMTLATRLQQEAPDSAIGYRLVGDIIAATGDPKDAVPLYRQAIAKNPSADNYRRLYYLQAASDPLNATATAKEWLELAPKDPAPALILAGEAERRKDSDTALRYYQKVISNHPDQVIALNNAAWLLMKIDGETALKYAKRASELAPDNNSISDTYGMILLQQSRPEKALIMLQRAAAKDLKRSEFGYHAALALYALGRRDDAITRLGYVLRKNQDFGERAEAEQTLKTWETELEAKQR